MGLFHGHFLEIRAHTSVRNHRAQGFSSWSTCQALIDNKIKWWEFYVNIKQNSFHSQTTDKCCFWSNETFRFLYFTLTKNDTNWHNVKIVKVYLFMVETSLVPVPARHGTKRAKFAKKVHKPPLRTNVINFILNGFNASIWVPWSPSDPKKLWSTDWSIQFIIYV